MQKSLARKSVQKLDKSAIENAQNGGTTSTPTSARSSAPTSARAMSAVDEDAEIERMVREEMEREEADRRKFKIRLAPAVLTFKRRRKETR